MTQRKVEILLSLGCEDPFSGDPIELMTVDLQGWGSSHRYLSEALADFADPVVVDVGVWKGGSTITMGRELARLQSHGVILSVDTFLGSVEHYLNPAWRRSLRLEHGHPHLYFTFMANIREVGLEDFVLPIALDSNNASRLLGACGVAPDVVHIDASHNYEAVLQDIRNWFDLLRPGGVIICDDYAPDWTEVVRAVDAFRSIEAVDDFESVDAKCRFRKPLHSGRRTIAGGRRSGVPANERETPKRLKDELEVAIAMRDSARAERDQARTQLGAVLASRSWRATSWYRRARGGF